jgi:hypothetical protein
MNCPVSPAEQLQYIPHSAVQEGLSVQSRDVEADDAVVEVWVENPVAVTTTAAPPTGDPECSTLKIAKVV